MAMAAFGDRWHIWVLKVSPDDVGYGMLSRPRQFIICSHRAKTSVTHNIPETFEVVRRALRRGAGDTSPSDCIMASKDEIQMEAKIMCDHIGREYVKDYPFVEYALGRFKQEYVAGFNSKWEERHGTRAENVPWLCYQLGDDPDNRLVWSEYGKVPTLRKGKHLIYFPSVHRWPRQRQWLQSTTCISLATFSIHRALVSDTFMYCCLSLDSIKGLQTVESRISITRGC